MAPGNWRTGLDIEALLKEKPERFDFYQAVKLIEQLKRGRGFSEKESLDTGQSVSFSSAVSQSFPASNIADLKFPEKTSDSVEMRVNFMGLAGAHGPLPAPVTEMIIDQTRSKNHAAAAFLDIFNNRLIQLFYKSRAQSSGSLGSAPGDQHAVGQAILSIAGLAGSPSHNRAISDMELMRFAGLLAKRPLSRVALEKIISGLFNVQVKVKEFVGRWLSIDASHQTCIGRKGLNNELGQTTVLGTRSWDQGGAVEIELGPLSSNEFSSFLADGDRHKPIQELVQLCVDPGLTVRLRLKAESDSRSPATLGSTSNCRLGWSSWLIMGGQSREDSQVTLSLRS